MYKKNETTPIAKALLLLVALSVNSCSKLDQSILKKIGSEKTGSESALPIMPVHRGVYVDSFQTTGILGNTLKEDSLLNWCVKESFNEVTLYNIGTILNTVSDKIKLNAFVAKAHTWTMPIKVSFVTTSTATVTKIKDYITSYPNDPDGVASEYEFWNVGYSYAGFVPIMNAMTNLKLGPLAVAPSIERQLYISQFEDQAGITDSFTIARDCINGSDEIFLVNYSATPTNFLPNNTRRKLQLLANQAAAIGVNAKVVVLFTCKLGFPLHTYFMTHHFYEAFNAFMVDYAALSLTNKSYIQIRGYQIYRHSDGRTIRPL